METVKIENREIPMRCTVRELAEIEEQIDTMDKLNDMILKGRRRLRNIASAIRILGNSGLRAGGGKADLTDDWVLDHMDAAQIRTYQIAIMAAVTEAFHMETEEDTVRDPVLEEIERKKGQGN